MRCSPKVFEVLPLLYLPRLYGGDFTSALREFFGSEAGLSPVTAAHLTEQWQEERSSFVECELSEKD
jgi:hypothetical protein